MREKHIIPPSTKAWLWGGQVWHTQCLSNLAVKLHLNWRDALAAPENPATPNRCGGCLKLIEQESME